jgi:ankyrin repeat protein
MAAASEGHIGIVRLLLDKGAQVSVKDKKGRTALWHAANHGYDDVVELLRKATLKK